MNTMIKVGGGFIIGAIVGAAVAYFATRDHWQAIADEQIESMREYYIKYPPKEPEKNPREENSKNNSTVQSAPLFDAKSRNYQEISQKYTSRYSNPSMEDLISRITEETDDEGNVIGTELNREDRKQEPYIIDEEDYCVLDSIFQQEALEFWNDNVLTVADSDEVLDITQTIGEEAAERLREYGGVIFVRNEWLGMEYEIEYRDQSYAEWIGANGPVDPDPIIPIQKRRRNKYEDDED